MYTLNKYTLIYVLIVVFELDTKVLWRKVGHFGIYKVGCFLAQSITYNYTVCAS